VIDADSTSIEALSAGQTDVRSDARRHRRGARWGATKIVTTGKVDTPNHSKYANGLSDDDRDGVRCFGHGGGAPGMNGQLTICDNGYTIAVLANLDPMVAGRVERSCSTACRWSLSSASPSSAGVERERAAREDLDVARLHVSQLRAAARDRDHESASRRESLSLKAGSHQGVGARSKKGFHESWEPSLSP
jgi:hypothetical protein